MGNRYLNALDIQGTVGTMHGLAEARDIVKNMGNSSKSEVLRVLRDAEKNATVATGKGLRQAISKIEDM